MCGIFGIVTKTEQLLGPILSGSLLAPLLAVLPLQMLAYRVSVARGYDPDFPRNLSKTLTVD